MAAKKTFEENMARLEQIVTLLEKGDAQLTDSLTLFEEGTKLAAQCRKELDSAEQKVVIGRAFAMEPDLTARRWKAIFSRRNDHEL